MNPITDSHKGLIRQTNEALILSAAEQVFARAGYGGATMAAIADLSGLPKANLHYYFGSKDVLYRAVLARTLNDWLVHRAEWLVGVFALMLGVYLGWQGLEGLHQLTLVSA